MLICFLYMYWHSGQVYGTGTFDILQLHTLPLEMMPQILIFLSFLLAFAVKVPMWPVHTWLPDAHVQAPTAGSVVLAAILLKMGGYGFLRFSLPMFPVGSEVLTPLVLWMSAIAIVYTSLVALAQEDMKKLKTCSKCLQEKNRKLRIIKIFACIETMMTMLIKFVGDKWYWKLSGNLFISNYSLIKKKDTGAHKLKKVRN